MAERVAIVTGSGSGIGKATAAGIVATGGVARFIICDVASSESVQTMIAETVSHFGRIDILVNNAGIPGPGAPVDQFPDDAWDQLLAINLGGVFRCTKYAVPHLEASGNGAIVNIASTFGMIGAPETPAYAAAKGGVVNLTRQLAVDLGPRGIRVNAVSPGYVNNDMARRGQQLSPEAAEARWAAREAAAALQPLGRQAETIEIARVVAFLASDEASFMTGAIVPVDGGCTATFNRGTR